jgi:hypothetical protein
MSIRLHRRARARDRSLTAGRKLRRRDHVRSTAVASWEIGTFGAEYFACKPLRIG